MLVKKTKKGKFSCTLSHHESDYILKCLNEFLEFKALYFRALRLDNESKANSMLHYCVVTDLLKKHQSTFTSIETEQRFSFSRSEALALLLLLKEKNLPMAIQELKSSLHKLLS